MWLLLAVITKKKNENIHHSSWWNFELKIKKEINNKNEIMEYVNRVRQIVNNAPV